ncbi:hypothetical protein BuS5_00617 [Desulfosarcina sp. BuS5]|uniref:pilus assembly PilX family protein n=1 Tax=Desulfosarcina sp. BuS5 TaxID=933262 RepID=UPI0004828DEB|nr:pilus assembly PilX N-terminal domain-containing protein [Desulfosarcina sp. BuS5]WDN87649.1 hypothetical protein BuS5_00617 [Desulfosarcina sp. BuS5]
MKQLKLSVCNQNGSVLLISVVILMLLTLLGIFATTTSTIEIQIAGNDKWHKMAFYNADGGVEASKELIEQNIELRGFPSVTPLPYVLGGVGIYSVDFFMNPDIDANMPSDTNRNVSIPAKPSSSVPHTNILIGGNTSLSTGSALQMIAGYEGKGKGAAGGGGQVVYDIRSRREGINNARATIMGRWRHVM